MLAFLEQNGSTPEKMTDARAELAAANEVDRLNRRSALIRAERQIAEDEKVAAVDRWAAMHRSNRTQAQIRQELIDQTIADGKRLGKAQSDIDAEIANISAKHKDAKPAAVKAYQDDAGTKYLQDLREQEAALYRRLAVSEKLTGAAKDLAEFEQKIADLKGKGQLTTDQKNLLARQGEIRAILQEMGMLEKLGQIEDEEAKKKAKRAQDTIMFQDRAAQIQEQIETAQAGRRDAYARTLGGFGKSDAEQQRIQEINGLYRESMRLQDQLTKATPKSQLGSDNYLAEIASIKNSLSVSMADHASYYANLQKMQGSWSLGASSALATYAEESANVAKQMQGATTRAFQGMEDQLVGFVTTGKASFSGLINSMLADLVRLQIRQSITGPLAGALNGLLGGAGRAAFSQTAIGSSGFGSGLVV
jgi:lambda family phage tail tape measure protein